TNDAHYLFCLAQMPGPRDGATRSRIASAFLNLDRKLTTRKLLTDRNWTINIRDALEAHLELDPELAATMQKVPGFGHPSHAYLLTLLPGEIQAAGANAMAGYRKGWSAGALNFVQLHLAPAQLLPIYRSQWEHPGLRPVLTTFLAMHGTDQDKKLVEEFYRPPAGQIELSPFNERLARVDWESGDAGRGQTAYARFTCTACHSGNTRLGPDLKNIAKRFGRDDLFRHINEPNLAVSDLYKAIQITTREGTYVGVPVYKSEAQTILETGAGETIRFSRHDILSERRPNQSPMPPGLLLAADQQELADLYAYLKTL
ncbi:MAG: c-type cytochrome, partial [Akkermansiaceae bacterium]|nr:c-type cytochrome [Akkermansiaceae bacterium]